MDLTAIPLASAVVNTFYIVGGALAALALVVSALGVKKEDFPNNSKTAVGVIAFFSIFVVASAAYAVLAAREEQKERREHLAEAEAHGKEDGEKQGEAAPAGEEGETDEGEPAPEEEADGEAATEVTLVADPEGALVYDKDFIEVPAGEIDLTFENPSSIPHDVVIVLGEKVVADTELITDDTTSTSAVLDADSYSFYCSVPGHREAGMEGDIEVRDPGFKRKK